MSRYLFRSALLGAAILALDIILQWVLGFTVEQARLVNFAVGIPAIAINVASEIRVRRSRCR